MFRRVLMVLVVLAATSRCGAESRPSDCPAKYAVCLSESEARSLARERAELEMRRAQVDALQNYIDSMRKIRSGWRNHFGFGVAVGVPIAYCPDLGSAQSCVAVTPGLVWRF